MGFKAANLHFSQYILGNDISTPKGATSVLFGVKIALFGAEIAPPYILEWYQTTSSLGEGSLVIGHCPTTRMREEVVSCVRSMLM